jgi:transcription elongation factor Elf1
MKVLITKKMFQFKENLKKLGEWLNIQLRMTLNEVMRKHYKIKWKEKLIEMKVRSKPNEDLPKKRYPVIDKMNYRLLDDKLPKKVNPVRDKYKECFLCNKMGIIVFSCKKNENKGIGLLEVCNICFDKLKLRFGRHLQNMDVQSFVLFKSLISDGKNMNDNYSSNVGKKLEKFDFLDLKRLKKNEAELENNYKKIRIKIPSMEDDVPVNVYSMNSQYGFRKTRKIIYSERNEVENNVKYSKVCGVVKLNAPKNANHMKRSLFQFNKQKLEGREFWMNSLNCLKNFSRLKITRITEDGRRKKNDFIPGWMVRSKHLIDCKENKFTRSWKFKKSNKFDTKRKFKMKDLIGMANDTLNPTSSEGINERFSTASEEQ